MISGHGPIDANIILVSDYATKEDIISGYALSGQKESILNRILHNNSYSIDQIYRTTLVKGELSYYGKSKQRLTKAINEAEKEITPNLYRSILLSEIIDISPNIIVPLGDLSLDIIAGIKGIEKYRGSMLLPCNDIQTHSTKTIKVIPTLDPEFIYQDFSNKILVDLDIKKIIANRLNDKPIENKYLIWICKTITEFNTFIQRHINKGEILFTDIETYFGIPTAISFCFDGIEAISVPLFTDQIDEGNGCLLLDAIDKLLRSSYPKGNQNIKYDTEILERIGSGINNIKADTMLAASLIYPELPKRLSFSTSIYTDIAYYKDDGRDFDPRIHSYTKFLEYNAKDSLSACQIHKRQLVELEELGLTELYNKVIQLIPVYKQIDQTGILVDIDKRDQLLSIYKVTQDIYNNIITSLSGEEINFNSYPQVNHLIYEVLKFPPRRHTTKGGKISYTTDEDTLEELAILHGKENTRGEIGEKIIWYIIACRKLDKLIQYLSVGIHPDGRLRTSYNLAGTETGRTSTGRTLDIMLLYENGVIHKSKRLGVAFHTIPKHGFKLGGIHNVGEELGVDIREIFIPTPGYVFIEADLSQAESRVCAVLGEAYEFLKLFDIPPGIHCLTTSWCLNCDPNKIEKGSQEYQIGKTIRHAGERNLQPPKLAIMLQKTLNEAQNLLNKFHENSPHIYNVFHRQIREFVSKNAYLIAPNGRRRDFFSRMNEPTYNEAISQLPQAVVSDQTKFAMLGAWNRLDRSKFRFIYEGHDSCMSEVREDYKNTYCNTIKEEMEQPINFSRCSLSRDFDLIIPCEITIGEKNWGEMRKI